MTTPLAKKLGIRPGSTVSLVGAPDGFERALAPLPEDVEVIRNAEADADVVLVFARDRRHLERALADRAESLPPTGALWLAWPKKSSGIVTDLSDAVVQETGLATGLVDNKVCAIDAVWSALRFVVRRGDRARRPARRL